MNRDIARMDVRECIMQLLLTSRRFTEWASKHAERGNLALADDVQRMANKLRRLAERLTEDERMMS